MKTVILWGVLAKQLILLVGLGFAWGFFASVIDLPNELAFIGGIVVGFLAVGFGLRYFGDPYRIDFD